MLEDQRLKVPGIFCKRKEYRDESPSGGEFDGLSSDEGLSGTRLAEYNGAAVGEDVIEMNCLVKVAATGKEVKRRPVIPTL